MTDHQPSTHLTKSEESEIYKQLEEMYRGPQTPKIVNSPGPCKEAYLANRRKGNVEFCESGMFQGENATWACRFSECSRCNDTPTPFATSYCTGCSYCPPTQ